MQVFAREGWREGWGYFLTQAIFLHFPTGQAVKTHSPGTDKPIVGLGMLTETFHTAVLCCRAETAHKLAKDLEQLGADGNASRLLIAEQLSSLREVRNTNTGLQAEVSRLQGIDVSVVATGYRH